MNRPQGVRALLWLKSREWLGESREPARLWVLGLGLLGWICFVGWAAVRGAEVGRLTPSRDLLVVAAAAWPLWAVIPLLGGGGGEVVAAHRLAPYPVTPRAVFGAAWLTALADLPYLVVLPLVLGLATAYAGLPGLVAALAFAAGSSATGQLLAWMSYLALAGRKRSGLTALVLTGAVVGLLGALPALLPRVSDVAAIMPGGWLRAAAAAAYSYEWTRYAILVAFLAAPVGIALLAGPALAERALDREARAGGVGARPWGTPGWAVRGSVFRALTAAAVRSMGRAIGAQVALAGVLAVPTITQLPGVNFAQVSLVAMGGVAGIAGATVLGVNAFAFDAGGAPVLLSWPVRRRDVLAAKATALALCLFAAQAGATVLGAFVLKSDPAELARALVLCAARTAAVTGAGLLWSVLLPSPSDYDSLRARISTPGAITSFVLAAAVATYGVSQSAQHLRGLAGALAVLGGAVMAGLLLVAAAHHALDARGVERVAAGVSG